MAVMYLDLDGFKQINDTLGHDAGDTLLSLVAARLVAAVRQEDTVARLGGDEFVIALWELGQGHNVGEVASKVIRAVSQPFSIQGHGVSITASAGIGIYPVHGEDPDTLIRSADLALYEAKRAGRNAYRISERADRAVDVRSRHDPAAFGTPAVAASEKIAPGFLMISSSISSRQDPDR